MVKNVILSPHFDDAVFSCWYLINHLPSEVITIFGGVPPSRTSTLWDRLCGESDSTKMMMKRKLENKSALDGTGTSYRNLSYLDKQYRSSKLDILEITNNILLLASSESQFFAPLALGKLWKHPDHVIVRNVGKLLLSQGRKVSFYADVPYMQMPKVVTEKYKERIEKFHIFFNTKLLIQVHELSKDQQNMKLEAMMKYRSQYKMSNLISLGTLKREANLKREVLFIPN